MPRLSDAIASSDTRWYAPGDEAGAVARSAATFRAAFGTRPDGTWAAPGRVNLIGEHVDYNGGRCLPIALPQRTYCAARRRSDGVLWVTSGADHPPWEGAIVDLAPSGGRGWARYVAGAVWALRRAGVDVPGLDVTIDSDVPIGAGLSSSAALICAVAIAAADLADATELIDADDRAALTAICVDAETAFVGAPTGGMDQAAALRTRAGHALLLDCRDESVEHLAFDLGAVDLALLVIDTGVVHDHVEGGYGDRRRGCERAARRLGVHTLREIADATQPGDVDEALRVLVGDVTLPLARHVVTEMHRVDEAAAMLRAGHPAALGPLLDASHASLRDDFAVSCPELDVAAESATAAGALGARLTGGGFGGAAIALVPAGQVGDVATAVDAALAATDLTRPMFLLATAGGAAGRVD